MDSFDKSKSGQPIDTLNFCNLLSLTYNQCNPLDESKQMLRL